MAEVRDLNVSVEVPTKTAAYLALERASSIYPMYEINQAADMKENEERPTPKEHAEAIVEMSEVFIKFLVEERI